MMEISILKSTCSSSTHIKEPAEHEYLLDAIKTIPCVKSKVDWAMRWISDQKLTFTKHLVAFATVKGIFFSGSFMSIFWLKKHGLMPGLMLLNKLIGHDKGMHTNFMCLLFSHLKHCLHPDIIRCIITDAIKIEQEFLTGTLLIFYFIPSWLMYFFVDTLPCELIGMNFTLMCQYIEFVTDRLLVGNNKEYNVINPFNFIDMISLQGKMNFFEKCVSDYSKANINHSSMPTNEEDISHKAL
jgi:ribonucleoside-diphosphate reductase subunit M2